jgi:LruC domain-containing protein
MVLDYVETKINSNMNINLRSLLFGLALLTASCKKENTVTIDTDKLSGFTAPSGFDFATIRNVSLSIGITDTRFGNNPFVVGIYLTAPNPGDLPIAKGRASLTSPFLVPVQVPSVVTSLYVVKTAIDGSSVIQKVNLNEISTSLSNTDASYAINAVSKTRTTMQAVAEPSCGKSVTDPNITIKNASDVICFNSNSDATIYVTANTGGTLKLNAPDKTITIGDNFNHTSLDIYISAGTTVRFTRDLEIKSGEILVNNGTLLISNYSSAGALINNGKATFTGGNFNLNSGSELTNYGTATVDSYSPTINNVLFNSGHFTFNHSLTVNGAAALTNNCSLIVNETFTVNSSKTVNNKLIVVKGDTYINGGGILSLNNGAMVQTNSLSNMDGVVVGLGDAKSLFQVVNTVGNNVLNNGAFFKGNLQYWGKQDIEDNQNKVKHFSDGATKGSDVYITKDDCNTLGNGTSAAPSKPDADGDGIIDEQDDYPQDPTKAFNNHSCNYAKGGSTIIFEDNWPAKADYDLNDIVLRYKHLVVTNANNVIVRLEGEWNLVATGGDFNNGAGIMFNLPKGNASNFTASNGLKPEASQDSLVVILFTDSRKEMETWNTKPGEALSAIKKYTFSFDVVNGPTLASLGGGGYNPFIWNGSAGYGRGYETHLYGQGPTKLADATLFGTKDDNSISGKKYTTQENLPWGLQIPVADFKYPKEYNNITAAYLKFANWASSGGRNDLDWYSGTSNAYRDEDKIFPSK